MITYQDIQEYAYAIVLLITGLCFGGTKILSFFDFWEHPWISAIIGSAAGIAIVLISPFTWIAAIIVALIVMVLSNFLITKFVAPKLDDVFDATIGKATDNMIAKGENRDFQKILASDDSKERVKFLMRYFGHSQGKWFYAFTTNAPALQIYQQLVASKESLRFYSASNITIENGENEAYYFFKFTITNGVYFVLKIFRNSNVPNVGITINGFRNAYNRMKFKEGMAFEKLSATVFDAIYIFVKQGIQRLDNDYQVKINK